MYRRMFIASLLMLTVVPLLAQAPKGWKLRIDRSASATDPDKAGTVQFMAMGGGFHAINPQAAVYWNPANTASGTYTLKGSFTQLKPSSHPNYYGLVFGGSDLEGAGQQYVYFTVAQDGMWLLKTRKGDGTQTVAQMSNGAVKKPDASGRAVNALEVRVAADKVDYVVNGMVVHSTPKASSPRTDGIYGFRVNHDLEVQVDNLAVAK